MFNAPQCKKCNCDEMIVKTNDYQTIVECAECSYTYVLENNDDEVYDVEECQKCDFVGVLSVEMIDVDTALKICHQCGHSYAVSI